MTDSDCLLVFVGPSMNLKGVPQYRYVYMICGRFTHIASSSLPSKPAPVFLFPTSFPPIRNQFTLCLRPNVAGAGGQHRYVVK